MTTVQPAIAKWLMIATMLLGMACSKDPVEQPPPPGKEYDILTTGVILNPANNYYDAFYWINDQRVPLDKAGAWEVFPYGMEKAGNDLYIAGGYAESSLLMPCYWKNGVRKNLPTDGLNILQRCGARDVKWYNHALYILGDVDLSPVIWKIVGDQITTIPVKADIARNAGELKAAMNLEVYNNQLYFAGAQVVLPGNEPVHEIGYWTMNAQEEISFTVMETNLAHSLAYSMAVSPKGVFIAGEYGDDNAAYFKPAVWTTQGKLPVVNQVNHSSQRMNEVVSDADGKVFLNVLDYAGTRPLVWKIADNGYELLSPAIPAAAKGYVNNLALYKNMLAYGYTYSIGEDFYAGYYFNGRQLELSTPAHDFMSIHRTGIFPK